MLFKKKIVIHPVHDANEKYFVLSQIGHGGSSNIYLTVNKHKKQFAAKVMIEEGSIPTSEIISILRKEEKIFQMLSLHPNVLKHHAAFDQATVQFQHSKETVSCIILEYAPNGNLYDFIKFHGGVPEEIALFFFTQIWSVVFFMHEWGIVHWDIKPENLLLDENYNVKVSDFGSSEIMADRTYLTNRKGTKTYMAPEMFPLERTDPFDPKKADVFSLGVTLLTLLRGVNQDIVAFKLSSTNGSEIEEETDRANKKCPIKYEIDLLPISEEWRDLLKSMLSLIPEDRPSTADILDSLWVKEGWKRMCPSTILTYIYTF